MVSVLQHIHVEDTVVRKKHKERAVLIPLAVIYRQYTIIVIRHISARTHSYDKSMHLSEIALEAQSKTVEPFRTRDREESFTQLGLHENTRLSEYNYCTGIYPE